MSINTVPCKVAVLGSGISGALCASTLAKNGVSVTLFDSARGPGGRMSQRKEVTEDGKELLFDHGAPCFSSVDSAVKNLVSEWESMGVLAEWKEKFGTFDFLARQFVEVEQEGLCKRYVGIPGMNSICRALCHDSGVQSKFGINVGKLEWLEIENIWSVMDIDGQNLGHFGGVVLSEKMMVSPKFEELTGRPPPLDPNSAPELAAKLNNIPAIPHFAVMLAFAEPLSRISLKGFKIINSEILSWAHCDSSKPGRSPISERWVLHSTVEYAKRVIAQTDSPFQKLSNAILQEVAEELFQEFAKAGLGTSQPFFKKAHRWGSAFPGASIARDDKCLWDEAKGLAVCGDFCVSPNVEGAIISGLAAASKLIELLM